MRTSILSSTLVALLMSGCGSTVSTAPATLDDQTGAMSSLSAQRLRVLATETIDESPVLVAALVKLQADVASGKAISIANGVKYAVKDGERLRKELKTRLNLPDGVKASFVNQFKYELDDAGKDVSLSIYTVLEGKTRLPEASHTVEHAGSPSVTAGATWAPSASVFGLDGQDDEHVSRAASFLTLLQTTSVSLQFVAERAGKYGFVYRVEPEVYFAEGDADEGIAAYNVLILNEAGQAENWHVALPSNR